MIVRHERSGGFAGITINVEIDSSELSKKQAEEMETLVEKAFPAGQAPKKKPAHPDQFDYEFTIEDMGKSQTYQVNDESMTDEIRNLSKWLIATKQSLNK